MSNYSTVTHTKSTQISQRIKCLFNYLLQHNVSHFQAFAQFVQVQPQSAVLTHF